MSKSCTPLCVGDVSALARNLRRRLQDAQGVPGHVEMLNLLAKSAGYRNFQHCKAQHEARAALDAPAPQAPEINFKLVKRLLRLFDEAGRLRHWPKKHSERMVCLWVMWSRIEARKTYTEREISEHLDQQHLFGDHALLRRLLVDHGLVARTPDGREYKRLESRPPAEAVEVVGRVGR